MGGGSRETRRREGEKTRQTRGENKENKCHTAIKESNTELKKKKEKKKKLTLEIKTHLFTVIYRHLN